MKDEKRKSPVIIIGMHRTGTTMITKLLEEYGIYFGSLKEHHNEAIFFLKINEKILEICNSSWNNPYKFDSFAIKKETEILKYMKHRLKGQKSNKLYWQNYDENKSLIWGWKDPRNTITLRFWKNIYPDAKVIHIYRNPMDVAVSLMNREIRFSESGKLRWYYNVVKNYIILGFYVRRAPELVDLSKGIKLWKYYVEKAFINDKNIIHIQYEEFLENPEKVFYSIIDFLSLPKNPEKVKDIIKKIDKSRRFVFIYNPQFVKIYEEIKNDEILKRLKYNNIGRDL